MLTLSFSGPRLSDVHAALVAYTRQELGARFPADAAADDEPGYDQDHREALRHALPEINRDGAELGEFLLGIEPGRSLSWPEIRAHIGRDDDREALNVLSHLQTFTTRRLGRPLLVKTGGRGRTTYRLDPVYEDPVLIWHKNRGRDGKPVIHRNGSCPSIMSKNPPMRSVAYAGQGTAGWAPASNAERLRNQGVARLCERCMEPGA